MKFAEPTTLHRKSGVWGTRDLLLGKDSPRPIPSGFSKTSGMAARGHPGFCWWVEAGNLTLLQRE
jgi:hypothetical protein